MDQSETALNRKELISVVREYRSTVQRAKSQQTLKNYHRQFKEKLQTKLNKTNEKHYEQISKTLTQDLYSSQNFNIWPLLFSLKSQKLNILIPTTLYHDSKIEFLAYSKDCLEIQTGPKIFNIFLKNLPENPGFPSCIFKPLNGKTKLFSSLSSINSYFKKIQSFEGYLQYYIPPSSSTCSILLSYIKKSAPVKSFIIQNTEAVPQEIKTEEKPKKSELTADKILKVMVKEFYKRKGVQQLKRKMTFDFNHSTSNSALMTEQPSFTDHKPKNFTNLAERIRCIGGLDDSEDTEPSQLFFDTNSNKFKVVLSNTKFLNNYRVKATDPALEFLANKIFQIIQASFKKNFKVEISETVLSFVKDCSKNWLFLNVKVIKYEKAFNVEEENFYREAPDDFNTHMSFFENSMVLNKSIIQIIENAKKNKHANPVLKVRRLENIKAKKFGKVVKKRENLGIEEKAQRVLDEATKKLDVMRKNARLSRKDFVGLEVKYSASVFWKELSVKVYRSALVTKLNLYFAKATSDKFSAMSNGLFKVFCCETGAYFFRYIERVHKRLNISEEDFYEFKRIFFEGLKGYIVDQDDLEIVSINFEVMKPYVVCDYNKAERSEALCEV